MVDLFKKLIAAVKGLIEALKKLFALIVPKTEATEAE